ncbi:MAG: hypothetical protein ACK528_09620, partial [Alphaproteobacteria bacterium]
MPLENISKAVYDALSTTVYTVSGGMRNAGPPTPCMVSELTAAPLDAQMRGTVGDTNHWIVSA